MNKMKLNNFWKALIGKTPIDQESYKFALADAIVGLLKDNDFIINANRMIVGCISNDYKESLEEAKPVILKHLKNQNGTMRNLAERINWEDGIHVCIGPAPEGVDIKCILAGDYPVDVWFYLEKVHIADSFLILSRNGWKSEKLDPQKRYILGRANETQTPADMITIPDAPKYVSREQAEISCDEGVWYCKAISEHCQTFVDGRFSEGDEKYPLMNLKKGGQIKFGIGAPGYILYYSSNN